MQKTVIWLLAIVILAAGGWYFYSNREAVSTDVNSMGSYPYICSNGMQFTMEPSEDVSTITLTPGKNATFAKATIGKTESAQGAVYEGSGIVFVGAGEEVSFAIDGNEAVTCNPVPNPDEAPWNWGDAGEGGGTGQVDVRLVVGESIMGGWKDTTDAKFTRHFSDFSETTMSGKVTDRYSDKVVTSGTYVTFTKDNPVQVSFPIEANAVYVQLTMQGSQSEKLNFKVGKLTPEELELVYMDRGGVLKFTSIQ